MTPTEEKVLKQAGETLTDLGLDIIGLASLTYDDERLRELTVNISHLHQVLMSLNAVCLSMTSPPANTSPASV